MGRKIAFVLIDGIGDVSIPVLGGKTPLETAQTPFMDAIAGKSGAAVNLTSAGLNGLMDPVEPGLACGSDTAHMSIFGYEPRKLYRGRGAYESMGAGLDMVPGDIAFKCNFATVDPISGIVKHRRVDRQFEKEGPILCGVLDGLAIPGFPQHTIGVKYATEHRCGIVVRGPSLTDAISGTDPLRDNLALLRIAPLDESNEAIVTANVVNAASDAIRQALEDHPLNTTRRQEGKPPANVVLLRGCGRRLALTPFEELHGLRGFVVAPTKIIAGLALCAGMNVVNVPGGTGTYFTPFHRKAETLAMQLRSSNASFGFLHVKAVDDAGHDRRVDWKVGYLQVVDAMIGQLIRLLWEGESQSKIAETPNGSRMNGCVDSLAVAEPQLPKHSYTIVVTGDHSTPVLFGDHSHEPVPFAIARVRHVVEVLGGDEAVRNVPLGPIPHPRQSETIPAVNGGGKENGFLSVLNGAHVLAESCFAKLNGNLSKVKSNGVSLHGNARKIFGDDVSMFTELDGAEGALGRFPGSQVMPLILDSQR